MPIFTSHSFNWHYLIRIPSRQHNQRYHLHNPIVQLDLQQNHKPHTLSQHPNWNLTFFVYVKEGKLCQKKSGILLSTLLFLWMDPTSVTGIKISKDTPGRCHLIYGFSGGQVYKRLHDGRCDCRKETGSDNSVWETRINHL